MGGFNEAEPKRFPAVERALIAFMRAQLQAGQPFWISPDLNSDRVSLAMLNQAAGLGEASESETFFDTSSSSGGWLSSIVHTATSIGNAALNVLPNAATIAGAVKSLQTSLGHNGIAVPTSVANAAVNSAQGIQLTLPMILLFGGAMMMFAMR